MLERYTYYKYSTDLLQGYLLTGSKDRTLKIYSLQNDNQYVMNGTERCLQTLRGHGQSVIDVSFNKSNGVIVTCSTDRAIRIFKDDSDKDFLVDPNFKLILTLDFSYRPKSMQTGDIHSHWFTCFEFIDSDENYLVIGDTGGWLFYIMEQNKNYRSEIRDIKKHHYVCIRKIKFYKDYNLVITLGADYTIKITDYYNLIAIIQDPLSNKDLFEKNLKTITNKNKICFTDVTFNYSYKEIVAIDEKGYLLIYNYIKDEYLFWKQIGVSDISQIFIYSADTLIFSSRSDLIVFNIYRNKKVDDMFFHKDTIFELKTVENKLANKLISCGYDDCVVTWDLEEMKQLYVIDCNEQHIYDLTSVTWSNQYKIIVTGHTSGDMYMWNPEIYYKRKLKKVHNNAISAMCNFCNSYNEEQMVVGSYDFKVSIWELLENDDSVGFSKKNVYWVNKVVVSLNDLNLSDIELKGKEVLLLDVVPQGSLNTYKFNMKDKDEEESKVIKEDYFYVVVTHNDGTISAISNFKNQFIGFNNDYKDRTFWTGLVVDRNLAILSQQTGWVYVFMMAEVNSVFEFKKLKKHKLHTGSILNLQFCKYTGYVFSLGKDKLIKAFDYVKEVELFQIPMKEPVNRFTFDYFNTKVFFATEKFKISSAYVLDYVDESNDKVINRLKVDPSVKNDVEDAWDEEDGDESEYSKDELNDLINMDSRNLNMGIESLLSKMNIDQSVVSNDVKNLLKGVKM